jgi:hypothetical protein
MVCLYDPPSRLELGIALDFGSLFVSRANVRDISPRDHDIAFARISCIKTEVFDHAAAAGLLHCLGGEKRANSLAVMYVGSGYDDRQRDATPVDENVALGTIFPLSVGLGPTDSRASGALLIVPSADCHSQAMPSSSSYSASPLRQIARKSPALAHS